MRTAPLGFLWDFGSPLRNGAACAAVTHGHPGGWIPAGILSDIVYRCIYGQSYEEGMPRVHSRDGSGIPACITVRPLEEIILSAVDDAEEMWESYPDAAKIGDMIRRAAELSRTDIPEAEAIHSIGGGWVGDEALAIAVYCVLRHPDDLRQCLITAVNHSGDSDSTGAIAGNILGAYLGEDALPEDWVCELEMTDVIRQQAENMASVIVHW